MQEWTDPQSNPPVTVAIRRKSNARRLSLRVSRIDGRATLTAPAWVNDGEIRRFLSEKSQWLADTCTASLPSLSPKIGQTIPFRGQMVTLQRSPQHRGAALLSGETLFVPGKETDMPKRVAAFLKLAARDQLAQECDHYVGRLPAKRYERLSIRDPRSRWGSCSASGTLMFSWRLIMAPENVLSYVVAHEVAHLVEMNHSSAFWAVVEDLMPDYKAHRNWLRHHGTELQRWRFAA
jgi:predicted metal-dependent hydrolase